MGRYDILTVGETPSATTEHAIDLTHGDLGALNILFQFEHMELDIEHARMLGKWGFKGLHLLDSKHSISRWQTDLARGGWNSLYLSNHDQARPVSRFGDDGEYRVQSAKLLGTFLHMLQGTPYVYQGEEIGMTNVRFESIRDYRDIETLNMYREFVDEKGMDSEVVMEMIYARSRDKARTPMQWDDSENAGFTAGTPWMRVNPSYREINVEKDRAHSDSIFRYYQRLIRLRKENPVIVYGIYELILDAHEEIYAFTRTLGPDRLLVILNFTRNNPVFALPSHLSFSSTAVLISNYAVDPSENIRLLTLKPFEARVYRLQG